MSRYGASSCWGSSENEAKSFWVDSSSRLAVLMTTFCYEDSGAHENTDIVSETRLPAGKVTIR
jgi:hypothetical protein